MTIVRRGAVGFVLLLAEAGCTAAFPPNRSTAAASDSLTVAGLVTDRLAAALKGDTAAWHRHVADDAVWTGPALAIATTRDVLVSLAANAALPSGAQELQGLTVHLRGDLAHATYVQVVANADSGGSGKRFRKTDTYQRTAEGWELVAATEIAIAERPRADVAAARLADFAGPYVLAAADTLTIVVAGPNRLAVLGGGATPDTLVAETDSSFYQEGDRGTWVFGRDQAGRVRRLTYRASGQADVVLRAVAGERPRPARDATPDPPGAF